MTKAQVRAILDRVRAWPEERQADLARIALQIEAQETEPAPEDEATRTAISEGLAQAKQRKFARDARVKATWRKFGL
jgi:hypothetical protein